MGARDLVARQGLTADRFTRRGETARGRSPEALQGVLGCRGAPDAAFRVRVDN